MGYGCYTAIVWGQKVAWEDGIREKIGFIHDISVGDGWMGLMLTDSREPSTLPTVVSMDNLDGALGEDLQKARDRWYSLREEYPSLSEGALLLVSDYD